MSSSHPRAERKGCRAGTNPAKAARCSHGCQTHWSRCRGAHDCWQGPLCRGSSSLKSPTCTESSPSSGQPGFPRHCQGTSRHIPLQGALTLAKDFSLLYIHKQGSPAGHRQPSAHSLEFHTRAILSLSMCQLDNMMSKARVQR